MGTVRFCSVHEKFTVGIFPFFPGAAEAELVEEYGVGVGTAMKEAANRGGLQTKS